MNWTAVKRRVTVLPCMRDCAAAPTNAMFTFAVRLTSLPIFLVGLSLSSQGAMSKYDALLTFSIEEAGLKQFGSVTR